MKIQFTVFIMRTLNIVHTVYGYNYNVEMIELPEEVSIA